jgi:hypothetical protein
VLDEKIESPSLLILNRWGQIVYDVKEYSGDWNGSDLPQGIYYYKITSECLSHSIQGSLTILR